MCDRENAGMEGAGEPSRREGFDMDAWWEDRSLPQKILLGIGFGIAGLGLLAICGWVVMALWNWLLPELFGLKRLDYWKAWGLLVLCWIFFKGIRFGSESGGRRSDRRHRQHLRRYMQEGRSAGEEGPAETSKA